MDDVTATEKFRNGPPAKLVELVRSRENPSHLLTVRGAEMTHFGAIDPALGACTETVDCAVG